MTMLKTDFCQWWNETESSMRPPAVKYEIFIQNRVINKFYISIILMRNKPQSFYSGILECFAKTDHLENSAFSIKQLKHLIGAAIYIFEK